MRPLYFDNQTTTRPSPRAVEAMLPFFREYWGALSMPHAMGQALISPCKESILSLRALLEAGKEDELVVTSCGAEAISQVLLGTYLGIGRPIGKSHFIAASTAQAPILMGLEHLETLHAMKTFITPRQDGVLTVDQVAEAMTPKTVLLSLSTADPLTGVLQPLEEIAALCQERSVLLHLDISQTLTCLPLPVRPDFITFNGDHFHAPKGTGGLLVREGLTLPPLIMGGSALGPLRGGTVAVPELIGLGEAAREALSYRDSMGIETARLSAKLSEGLLALHPESCLLFDESPKVPTTFAMAFPGISGELLLYALHKHHLYASLGGGQHQSLPMLLKTLQVPGRLAHSSVSFSLSRYTTEEDVDDALTLFYQLLPQLRTFGAAL